MRRARCIRQQKGSSPHGSCEWRQNESFVGASRAAERDGRDGEAAAAPVEVYSVVRPGQRQSKAQKWLNRTGLDTMTRHHADLHDNPSQILNADIADFKTVETKAHKEKSKQGPHTRRAR